MWYVPLRPVASPLADAHHLATTQVSAVPHTSETTLGNSDTHLLLACDGVWDVVSDQEAVRSRAS